MTLAVERDVKLNLNLSALGLLLWLFFFLALAFTGMVNLKSLDVISPGMVGFQPALVKLPLHGN